MNKSQDTMRVVLVGHVDHGKSTIVGRLLHDTDNLPDGKFESVKAMCESRGMKFEWSFVTDALKAERDQAVTIDASHITYRTPGRDYVLIDAPGHHEFLSNMISGAAAGDAALLVIDADEGVREQTRRHGYLLHVLGLHQVIVAVNKMDLAGFDEQRFNDTCTTFRQYLSGIGLSPQCFIPVVGSDGDNITAPSERMTWYDGPVLAEAMDQFPHRRQPVEAALRLPVQDVYKFDDKRIIAGRLASGRIKVGDTVLFSPSNKTTRVTTMESWNTPEPVTQAEAGQSVGLTLADPIFVERGEIISLQTNAPTETNVFNAQIFWLDAKPLSPGTELKLKLNTNQTTVEVQAITSVFDLEDLSTHEADAVECNGMAEVVLRSRNMLAVDEYTDNAETGRFMLLDGYDVVGGGVINLAGYPDQRAALVETRDNLYVVDHTIDQETRWKRNRHQGAVFWLTGLSASGKSTIAIGAENRLFDQGKQVYVLDGDNMRRGLNRDLGFSPEDRAENIRRVGEVAALFAEAGFIVITAFISPYRSDRDRVREAVRDGAFHEIYVKASVETCEARDPKGLYTKARTGEIEAFTGISAPYDEPVDPELVIDTEQMEAEQAVDVLVAYCGKATTV
jgi:bifunctional enzyme CysN/CysC